jgi:hypothetical protein
MTPFVKKTVGIVGGILGLYLVVVIFVLSWLFWHLRHEQWQNLTRSSAVLKTTLQPLSWVTFGQWREVEVAIDGLDLLLHTAQLVPLTQSYLRIVWPESTDQAERVKTAAAWQSELKTCLTLGQQWWPELRASWWWRVVPAEWKELPIDQWLGDAATANDYFMTGRKTVLLVWQNTQEVRASGGFMGSYARLNIQDALLTDFEIQDIYEPDGQFTGYVPAPPGVKEYLSSAKGLRLPDANWWPDFPQSAQTVLSYFAVGKEQHVVALVAMNLEIAEDVLRILGPVTLTDYGVTVTADNLATVARADRSTFFPGSQQKAHFLTQLHNQLKFEITTLSQAKSLELLQLWLRRAATKDVQFYSPDIELQSLASKYGLTGQTSLKPIVFGEKAAQLVAQDSGAASEPLYLELVESNVGINKANAGITRSVTVQVLAQQLQLQLEFANHHPKPLVPLAELRPDLLSKRAELTNGLGYVNYQRVLVSPYLKVTGIQLDAEPLTAWDETLVTWSGVTLKQIGFLVTVPEATERKVTVTLENTSDKVANLLQLPSITIQKQAGLPPTPYELFWANQRQSLVLETDTQLKL